MFGEANVKLHVTTVGAVAASLLAVAQPQVSERSPQFRNPKHVFSLRAEVLAGRAQAFDVGALSAAANRVEAAKENLQNAIKSSQASDKL